MAKAPESFSAEMAEPFDAMTSWLFLGTFLSLNPGGCQGSWRMERPPQTQRSSANSRASLGRHRVEWGD